MTARRILGLQSRAWRWRTGRAASLVALAGLLAGCAPDPDRVRLAETTRATYDAETGRLERLTYDANKNGIVDTWVYLDGTKTLRSETDADEDGKVERWEYYGDDGRVERVALSRGDTGAPDMWLYPGPDDTARAEVSGRAGGAIDRWEWYVAGVLVRAEEDADGNGEPDRWESYESGSIQSVAFDENGDGRPDRRLNYDSGGALLSIESEPDGSGSYTKKVDVRR